MYPMPDKPNQLQWGSDLTIGNAVALAAILVVAVPIGAVVIGVAKVLGIVTTSPLRWKRSRS